MLKKYSAPELEKQNRLMMDILTMSNDTEEDNTIDNPDGEIFG